MKAYNMYEIQIGMKTELNLNNRSMSSVIIIHNYKIYNGDLIHVNGSVL